MIFSRVSRSKDPDSDVTPEERSQAAKALKNEMGIDVYDQNGEFQDFSKTLDQVADGYDSLTDAQKANVAEAMSGSRNLNVMKNIIETWQDAKKLSADAMGETNFETAMDVQEKHMESMKGKMDTLKAQGQEFWSTLLDTGAINTGIEAITSLVSVLEKLTSILKSIGDFTGMGGGLTTLLGLGGTAALGSKLYMDTKGRDQDVTRGKAVKQSFGEIGEAVKSVAKRSVDGFNAMRTAEGGIFTKISAGATKATAGLGLMTKAFLGAGVAIAAISIAASVFDKLTNSSKETAKAVEEANMQRQQQQEALKSNRGTIDEIGSEFETLSKGVSPLGENISLTTEEFARYHEITGKIASMYPQLIDSYDAQGNAILNLKGNLEELNSVYENQTANDANQRLSENLDKYIENFNNDTGDRSWGTQLADVFGNFFGHAEAGGRIDKKTSLDLLEKVKNMNFDDYQKYMKELTETSSYDNPDRHVETYSYLTSKKVGLSKNMNEEEFYANQQNISLAMSELNADIESSTTGLRMMMQDYLTILTTGDGATYKDVDNNVIQQVSSIVNKSSTDFVNRLKQDGVDVKTAMNQYVSNTLTAMSGDKKAQDSLTNILGINQDSSIEDVKKVLEEDLKYLDSVLDDDEKELKLKFGLEGREDVVSAYDETIKELGNKTFEESKAQIEELQRIANANGGNVNLSNQSASLRNINQAGWNLGENDSTYMTDVIENGNSSFVVTPLLPDGTILSPEDYGSYLNEVILQGGEDVKGVTIAAFDKKVFKDATRQAESFAKSIRDSKKYSDSLDDNYKKVRDFIKDNNIQTKKQLDLLEECYKTTGNWSDAMREFSLENINLEANQERLKRLDEDLKIIESDIEKINEAVAGSQSSAGMSKDQIDDIVSIFSGLDSYNYDELFESTAEGVHLNAEALERLNGEYEKGKKANYDSEINRLTDEYEALCVKIDKTRNSTERNAAINERNGVAKQIQEARELQSRYEGLTNAVAKWQRAAAGGEEGDTYDSITQGKESAKELYDKGLTGTNEFKAFTQMLTDEDLTGGSNLDYILEYEEKIATIGRYFTEGAEGAEAFLGDLQNIGMAAKDASGGWTVTGDIEDMASVLGTSQAAITELFKKMKDYGGSFDFREESDNLKGLRKEAEKAQEVLSEEFRLNFNSIETADDVATIRASTQALREQFVKDFGINSEQVEALDKQLVYLGAKAGSLAQEEWVVDIHSAKGLEDLQKQLDELKNIGVIDIEIDFGNNDPEYINGKIAEVTQAVESMKNTDGIIDISQEGAEEAISILSGLIQKQQELEFNNNTVLNVDVSQLEDEAKSAIEDLQGVIGAWENLSILQSQQEAGIPIDTSAIKEAEDALLNASQTFENTHPTMAASLKIDSENIDFDADGATGVITTQLQSISPKMLVDADVNPEAVQNYHPDGKTIQVDANTEEAKKKLEEIDVLAAVKRTITFNDIGLNGIKNTFDGIASKNVTIYTTTVEETIKKANGSSNLNGTAYVNGTAGNWGAKKDETALVGEVAPELRVNSKTGQWELLGQNGAEFADINKGDVIFNGKQTEEIFKKGKISTRGKSFLNGTVSKLNSLFKVDSGTAYVSGSWGGGIHFGQSGSGSSIYSGDKDKDKGKEPEKPKESDFDWIEVAIQRIEEAIQRLDVVANSAYKSFTKRNQTLGQEFGKVTEQINIQQRAYEAYMSAANAIGLEWSYVQKIQQGAMNVETIVDNEELVDRINSYQDLYDKAIESKDAILELEEALGDLAQAEFDNVVTEYEYQLATIEHRINAVSGQLDILDAKGQFAGKEFYEVLMKTEKENINKLLSEYSALENVFADAMASGVIEQGSDAWYQMQESIHEVEEALQDANKSLIEYQNQMREMDWKAFEKGIEYIGELTSESDFIRELLSLNEVDIISKDTGKLTNNGQAVGGLHAVDYNVYMGQADEYRKKVEELNKELEKDPTNTTLLDKKNEYLEAQREAIKNAQDEKKAVHDLIESSYQKMLDILQEIIDKYKDTLNAEKSLYDYQKNIKSQTKNIKDIEKQLISLGGDDSEEAQSKKQQLGTSLEEAKEDLEETQYERYLDDQSRLLDTFYSQYEEVLNARLDDINGLMQDMIDNTNANAETIGKTITESANNVGYTITDGMQGIWNNTTGGFGKVVSDYSANFNSMMTTTNNYLKSINDMIVKATAPKVDVSKPSAGGSSSGNPNGTGGSGGSSSGGGSGSGGSSSGGSVGNFFVYKKNQFPVSQLNVNTSIIDRMKKNNFDTSWSSMQKAYVGMGFGSASSYVGSYNQNINMLNWMKNHGYSQGGQLKKTIDASGEDGIFFGRSGEEVLSIDKLKIADSMVSSLIDFARFKQNITAVQSGSSVSTSVDKIEMNFVLPDVKDGSSFLKEIQTNKKIQNAIKSITIGEAMGKNSLNKYK